MTSPSDKAPEKAAYRHDAMPGFFTRLWAWLCRIFAGTGESGAAPPGGGESDRADQASAARPQPPHTEEDKFAYALLDEIAQQLAQKLGVKPMELQEELWKMRQAGPTSGAAARVLRVDCLLTKEGPNRITICLSVLHQTERKPERLSLTRTLSWDDLPREVRSGFIHTGKRELAFVLCESEQGGKKTTTDQNKS